LHVITALASVDDVRRDDRYAEMVSIVKDKLDREGRAKPESIYMIYKSEEWSNKKEPSRLMTILVHRVLDYLEKSRRKAF
jgi:hypothetical protein